MAGSVTPPRSASSIARAEAEYTPEATLVSLIPASWSTFSSRSITDERPCPSPAGAPSPPPCRGERQDRRTAQRSRQPSQTSFARRQDTPSRRGLPLTNLRFALEAAVCGSAGPRAILLNALEAARGMPASTKTAPAFSSQSGDGASAAGTTPYHPPQPLAIRGNGFRLFRRFGSRLF